MKETQVCVMSRPQFEDYIISKHDKTSYAISITTPGDTLIKGTPNALNNIKSMIRLQFFDSDLVDDYYPGISDKQAEQIAKFIKKNEPIKVDMIIIHCDAGQSRSVGVAAAIMKYLNGDDSEIFNKSWYQPNRLCYRKVLNALFN